jgi:leucine dehydrogenase
MLIFNSPAFDAHEKVVFCSDRRSGLQAIIAIHSTHLGPAAGGCRMFPYPSEEQALDDVLRLSRAMTFKNALAGLALGGGKSVIIGDPTDAAAAARLAAFGRCVDDLNGRYWTAEDVGVNLQGVELIAAGTRFVFGTASRPGATGDPSAFTAQGVFAGLRAAVSHRLGRTDVKDLCVAVQGVGAVGWELCRILHAAGAKLVVADQNPVAAERAGEAFNAQVVSADRIYGAQADVFAPCAMGGGLNARTIAELQVKVIAGAANNPLEGPADGEALWRRNILYVPDFAVNAGGMMHASGEIFGTYDEALVNAAIEGIHDTVLAICRWAADEDIRPEAVALEMAKERLD